MLMTSQPGVEVQHPEAWQDLQICYISQSNADAAGTTKTRTEEPDFGSCFSLLVHSGDLKQRPRIALPSALVGTDRAGCYIKATQRGPGVAAAVIQELITPSSPSTRESHWIADSGHAWDCLRRRASFLSSPEQGPPALA